MLAVCLFLLPGCFRLSDPFYAFKDISAEEPPGPEYSLLFGSIEVEGGLLSPSAVEQVVFRRVLPGGEEGWFYVTENVLFRAFQRRQMGNGFFVLALPPGTYELDRLESFGWITATRWRMSEGGRVASRFYVTRPGVYDLGAFRIASPDGPFGAQQISRVEPPDPEGRRAVLDGALKGTAWERALAGALP